MRIAQRSQAAFVLATALIFSACTGEVSLKTATEPAFAEVADAVGDIVLPLLCEERTVYAARFSEEAFSDLRIGASMNAVDAALGQPLNAAEFPDGEIYWYYSRQATGTDNFFQRIVVFSSSSRRIVRTYSEFYVD
jgi:hypothetical protein